MVDAIAGGAGKAGAELLREATKELQKASEQVSRFEELRQKLEAQEMISAPGPGGANQQVQQAQATQGPQSTEAVGQAQKAGDIPKVTDMEGLEKVVDRLKSGQNRLNELISQATSGRTYSPQELIALQAEVSQITTEIQMCCKMVEQGISSAKTLLQQQV